jgi:hypothetical protein
VLKDLVASEQSLKLAVCTPEWGQLGMGKYSDTFRTAMLDEDTWECMKRLLELLKPFSDAILEADKPMLSQCHLVIQQLGSMSVRGLRSTGPALERVCAQSLLVQ